MTNQKQQTAQINLCKGCHCMTKTIKDRCGKCGYMKMDKQQTTKEKAIEYIKEHFDFKEGCDVHIGIQKAIDIALSTQKERIKELEDLIDLERKEYFSALTGLKLKLEKQHETKMKEMQDRYKVWKCNKCNTQLVEKSTKDYVDDRINRQHKYHEAKLKEILEFLNKYLLDDELEKLKKLIGGKDGK